MLSLYYMWIFPTANSKSDSLLVGWPSLLCTDLQTDLWTDPLIMMVGPPGVFTILEICFVAYSNPCNSLVFSSIFKNKVGFGKYFQFPVQCRKPHSSKSICLEMAGDCVKLLEFEIRKISHFFLHF